MDIKSLVFALWLAGTGTAIGTAQMPAKEQATGLTTIQKTSGGITTETLKKDGQVIAIRRFREEPKVEVQAPSEPQPEVQLPDDEWAGLIAKYFPADQIEKAIRIMRCESGVPDRVSKPNTNGTRDYGLFQINSIHAWRVGGDLNALLDSDINTRIASEIWRDAGNSWTPWVCNRN